MTLQEFRPLIPQFINYFCTYKTVSTHTTKSYTSDLMHLAAFWEQYHVYNSWQEIWPRYHAIYLEKLSPRSLSRKISTLKQFERFCEQCTSCAFPFSCRRKYIEESFPQPTSSSDLMHLDTFLATRQTSLLVRDQAIVLILRATGMLSSEVAMLKIQDLDFIKSVCAIVPQPQSKKIARTLPLSKSALNMIQIYLAQERAQAYTNLEYLFINAYGQGLTTRTIQRVCLAVGEHAQLSQPLTPQALRHAYSAEKRAQGISQESLNLLLGIKTCPQKYRANKASTLSKKQQ